jgi:hypothetical membrane protein
MTRVGSGPKPASRLAFQRASAACGVVAPILSVIVAVSVGYLHPGYSFAEQRLSDLGAFGAPYAPIFNVVVLMTSGVLVAVLSLGLYSEFSSDRVARIGCRLLTLSGASLFMTGIFPCDVGSVGATASGMLHGVFAGIGTFAIIGAALAMGLGLRRNAVWRNHSWFSLGVAVLAVSLYVPYQLSSLTQWEGAIQRMLVMVLLLWLEVMSLKLVSRSEAGVSDEGGPF